ncbi:MAG: AsmA family protein, partial [Nitrospirae bacterium]
MKKGVIIAGGVFLIIILIFAGLLIFAKSYLTDERIKTLVIPKIEETLHRKVSIGDLKVSLFSGINLEDIHVSDRGDKGTFIKGKSLVLKYRILPLLSKKLVIERITLVSPEINIKKDKEGRFNFEDLRGGTQKAAKKEKPSSSGFSLLAENIKIEDASFNLTDETGGIPNVKAAASADISISSTPSGKVSATGSVDIKNIFISYGELKPEIKGTLKFSDKDISMKMNVKVSDTSLEITGDVKDYMGAPSISLSLGSEKIDLDTLLASLKKMPEGHSKGSKKGNAGKTPPSLPEMSGTINLKNISYGGMNIGPVRVDYIVHKNKGSLKGSVSTEGGKIEIDVSGKNLTSSP